MKRADEILKNILENLHIEEEVPYSSFFNSWEKIAGIDIANHSGLDEVKNNILYISVDHPGWIQIIQLQKRGIMQRINSLFPELQIHSLRFFYKKHQLTE